MTLSSMLEPRLEIPLPRRPQTDRNPFLTMMAQPFGLLHCFVPDPEMLRSMEEPSGQVADAMIKLHVVEVLTSLH